MPRIGKKMEEFKLKTKCIELIKYTYIALRQFPKSEKFTLSADIKKYLYATLENIIKLEKMQDKKRILNGLDINLQMLKTLTNMSMELNFLPIKKYEIITKHIVELGKMIGGYYRSIKG